jgi:hypothetical protein
MRSARCDVLWLCWYVPLTRATIDYLEKYPEMLEKDADVIVEKALLEAYTRTG